LPLVVGAGDAMRPLFRLGQRRQQHGRQDGDNRNNHQQLDESESVFLSRFHRFRFFRTFGRPLCGSLSLNDDRALIAIKHH
jgi:hypothetical protein